MQLGLSGFNTQPPEGGWNYQPASAFGVIGVSTHSRLKAAGSASIRAVSEAICFNTQPPEGGWGKKVRFQIQIHYVSTHSRLKAAGQTVKRVGREDAVSTHSRLKAAG